MNKTKPVINRYDKFMVWATSFILIDMMPTQYATTSNNNPWSWILLIVVLAYFIYPLYLFVCAVRDLK